MTAFIRARFLIREVDERCGQRDFELLSVSATRGVIPRSEVTTKEPRADDLSNYKVCRAGDIVVNRMSAYQGALGLVRQGGIVSPDYIVFRPARGVEPRWLQYVMRSSPFVSEMAARIRGIGSIGTGNVRTPRVSAGEIGDIAVACPSPETRRAIADYLDFETARIDALIGKKERVVDLQLERCSAMRRSRLDDARRRGELPLRRLVTCLDGRRIPLNAEERSRRPGNYPYWGAGQVVDYIDDFIFDEDLVLLGEDGAPFFDMRRDVAFRVAQKVWVNNHIHVLRPRPGVDSAWLAHTLNAIDFGRYITGSTRDKLTQEQMLDIRVPNVPLGEQVRVAAELDAVVAKGGVLAAQVNRQVALLTERRQALISSAVTGKLEIPGAAA